MLKLTTVCVLWFCVTAKVRGHDETDTIVNVYTGKGSGHSHHDIAAFSVGRTTEFVPSATSRVPMDVVFYNEGGHYNTGTHVYTAPTTGLYSIFFGASGKSGKLTYLMLYAGNPEKSVAITYDYTNGFGQAGSRVMLKLNRGDSCSVWTYQAGGRYGLDGNSKPTTFFNGYLLQKL